MYYFFCCFELTLTIWAKTIFLKGSLFSVLQRYGLYKYHLTALHASSLFQASENAAWSSADTMGTHKQGVSIAQIFLAHDLQDIQRPGPQLLKMNKI